MCRLLQAPGSDRQSTISGSAWVCVACYKRLLYRLLLIAYRLLLSPLIAYRLLLLCCFSSATAD
jgi:hypothetical protein